MAVAIQQERSIDEAQPRACSFCESMRHDREPTIVENRDFVAWASVGALTEGHLLVIPRAHALNCAELESSSFHEFTAMSRRLLAQHYGGIALFEHGPARPGHSVGCSIDHAHLHLLPWRGPLAAAVRSSHPDLVWEQHRDVESAFDHVRDRNYLLVVDPDGAVATGVGDAIGSQVIRRVVTLEQGRPEEWNWKTHPQVETQSRTVATLHTR